MSPLDPVLVDSVRSRLAQDRHPADHVAIAAAVRTSGLVLDRPGLDRLTRALGDELGGLGALDPLLRDPEVTDVLVNAPDEVWLDRGGGLVRAPVAFTDEAAVRQLAVRLASRAGRRLDDATPYVDARLPGGQRLHAVIPPLSVRGTTISLRIPSRRRFTLADLVAAGSVDEEGAAWLARAGPVPGGIPGQRGHWQRQDLGARGTAGGRPAIGSGSWSSRTPANSIRSIRTWSASRPARPTSRGRARSRCGRSYARPCGCVPDRLVVGEVRGPEVVDLLAAMNTGHEGGCGTVHANSAAAVPDRLVALALAAGMTLAGVHAQAGAGLEVVVHLARQPDGTRVVAEIGVVTRGADGDRGPTGAGAPRGRAAPGRRVPCAVRSTRGHIDEPGRPRALRGHRCRGCGAPARSPPARLMALPVAAGSRAGSTTLCSRLRPAAPTPDRRAALCAGGRALRGPADWSGPGVGSGGAGTPSLPAGDRRVFARARTCPMPCAPTREPPGLRRCAGWLPAGRSPSGQVRGCRWRCPVSPRACVPGPMRTPSSPARSRRCARRRACWPGLPLLGLLIGQWIGAEPLVWLTGTWVGRGTLLAGLALQLLGMAWLRHMVAATRDRL